MLMLVLELVLVLGSVLVSLVLVIMGRATKASNNPLAHLVHAFPPFFRLPYPPFPPCVPVWHNNGE